MEVYERLKPHLSELETHLQSVLNSEDKRVYSLLGPYLSRGGKRVRPLLVFLSYFLTKPKPTQKENSLLIEVASIIEFFHNFTLIHDDIEDDSQFRRGVPTLHISHGLAMALNSGDALYTLLLKRLVNLNLPADRQIIFQKLALESFKEVVDGQGKEIFWIKENQFDVSESEYLSMIGGKTAALVGFSMRAGSFLASNDEKTQQKLELFGRKIGLAFQIHDDILNLIGDFEKYKKEIGGDISEGKRTLMVVHSLSKASKEDRSKLISILSSHTKDSAQIKTAIAIMKKTGSIDYAIAFSRKLITDAKTQLDSLSDSQYKKDLLLLADYFVSREQ